MDVLELVITRISSKFMLSSSHLVSLILILEFKSTYYTI